MAETQRQQTGQNFQANKQNVEKVSDEGEFGAIISAENSPMPGDIIECIETSTE